MKEEQRQAGRVVVLDTAAQANGGPEFDDKWYREVVEASSILVWACDREGRFTYLNPAWETSHGYKVEEMLGRSFSEFQRSEVLARDAVEFSRHLAGGAVTRYETSHVAKDGRDIHLRFNAKPLLDAGGLIIGTQGTAFEVSERKALESRIGLLKDEFERFFTLIPELTCIAGTDGYFKKLNPYWQSTLGYTIEELLGSPIVGFVHPDDIPATRAEIARQVDGLASNGFVNRYRHKDGSYRYLQWEATPVKNQLLYAVARDITQQIRLEEELKLEERRNKIELTLSQFPMGPLQELLDLALEEVIAFSDSKVGYLFQYDEESQRLALHAWSHETMKQCAVIDRQTVYQLSETGLWAEAVRQARPFLSNDCNADSEPESRFPAGHVRLDRFLSVPVFSNGRIVAVVGVGNKADDYTEGDVAQLTLLMERVWLVIGRKKTEAELRDSHERLRQLSAHMESVREEERLKISREVHDELGQMMTALKFDIAYIKETPALPPELSRKLEVMDANVSVGIRSVQTISGELRPKLLDDLGLVSAIEWHAKDFAERTGMVTRLDLCASLQSLTPECAITIFRIFQEALTNVQRHAAADTISVELSCREQEIVLVVSDNGNGIRERELFAANSFGIQGMHERASLCSGKLYVNGSPGAGTSVRLHIPVPSSSDRPAMKKRKGQGFHPASLTGD